MRIQYLLVVTIFGFCFLHPADAASSQQMFFLQAPSGRSARVPIEKHDGGQFDIYCVDRIKKGKGCVAEQVFAGNIKNQNAKKVSKDFAQQPHAADQSCLTHGGRVITLINKESARTPFCLFSKDNSMVSSWDLFHKKESKK